MKKAMNVLVSTLVMVLSCISVVCGATVSVSVSVDGGAVNSSVTGTFATCTKCDAQGNNCTTDNSGTVSLYLGNGYICAASGSGGASCSCVPPMDRGGLNGTHVFTGYASDCTGVRASSTYTLQLDNTPSISVVSPTSGTISGPFDVATAAQFQPTLNTIKGSILCYGPNGVNYGGADCTSESCSYSYNQWAGHLLQYNTGDYSVTCRADGGGVLNYDTRAFHVDETPTIHIASPTDGAIIRGPFDVAATAQFKPSLYSPLGYIICYGANGANYGGANCTSETCTSSYQQWSGRLLDLNTGSYTVTCRADGGGMLVYDTKSFQVDKTPQKPTSDLGSCDNGVSIPVGSNANIKSGNLYHSQDVGPISFSYNSIDPYWGTVGQGWTHNYNISVTYQTDGTLLLKRSDGNNIYFSLSNGIYSPDPASGDTSWIVKNSDGTYTQTTKDGIVYSFNISGNLSSVKDRNGNTITLTYNGAYLTSVTDINGRTTNITSTTGKISSITDPAGRVYNLGYSGNYLTSITDPTGHMWSYTYDSGGRMLTKTDPAGYTMTYTYDSSGRLLSSTDPNGKVRTMAYNPSTMTATLTDKDGGVWTYKYDPTLVIKTQKTDPLGNIVKYSYDSKRNLVTKTDPDGGITTYTYDSVGNTTSIKDALGNTTTYTYNSLNLASSITDPKGNITQYTYDANGNMLTMIDPANSVTQYQYDSKGNRISVTKPNIKTTAYAYDANNNLVTVTDPLGAVTTFTYDALGNTLTQTDPVGNITKFTYDSMNRLVTATDPKGNVTSYTYDPKGNKTSTTDANGNLTRSTYTYDGQVSNVTDALNSVTQLAYGSSSCPSCGTGADKLTSLTDAQGNITSYQYDLLGRVTQETDPAGNITGYTYDSKGNLLTRTDANGNTITFTYDLSNRLTGKTYPDGSTTTYQYDQTGNLIYASNQNIAYNLSYDADRRITGITDSLNRTIQYTYDAMGNRATMTAPDGNVTNYAYDASNRIYQIISGPGTFSFSYDNANRRTAQNNPNGSTVGYTYDADGWPTAITHKATSGAIIESFAYQYDSVGNKLTNTDIQGTHVYQYDSINQLTQALHPLTDAEVYTYDKTGNRITETRGTSTLNYTTIAGNRIQSRNGETFTYDGNGNIVTRTDSSGTTTYAYDAENRLIQAILSNGIIAQYKYDPLGRRIEKDVTVSGTTTPKKYLYDGANLLYEYDVNNNVTNSYTQSLAIDDPIALQSNGQTYYYLKDALGTINGIADTNGNIVQSYMYDAYGNIQTQAGSISQPFTFTGREYDTEIGLYFYRTRMYDARIGRFLQKDSLSFSGGDMNLMRYVQNNPVNNIDPLGLKVMLCTRQAFAGDWGRGHSSYIIPHCYIVAGDQIYSWNVEAGGGIHGNENPGKNSCGEIKCKGDQAAFENCVITEAATAKGSEGNIWIPAMHDCCTWANGVVGKCMKKHCKNNCS